MKALGWIKEHPVAAGSILAGGVVLLIILLLGGKSSSASPSTVVTATPTSDTAQSTALQAAQLQASVQTSAIAAQATTDQMNIAAAKDVALKNSDVSLANIYATADTSKYVATLGAQVENQKTQADKDINAAQTSAAVQIAQMQAVTDTTIASFGRDVSFDTNAKNLAIATLSANIAAQNIQYQTTVAGQQFALQQQDLGNQYIAGQNAVLISQQAAAVASQKNTYDFQLGVQKNQNDLSLAGQQASYDFANVQSGQAYNFAEAVQQNDNARRIVEQQTQVNYALGTQRLDNNYHLGAVA